MRTEWLRHIVLLCSGYALSAAAALNWLGPYRGYPGQPAAQRMVVLFLMPITAMAICLVIRSLQRRRPPAGENGSSDAAIRGIVFWVVAFLMAVHALLVAVLLGVPWIGPWAPRAVVVLVGLTVLLIGNLLPRTRPNMAIGIRTSRTLADRQLWMRTHRVTGYTAVALGAVTICAGVFVNGRNVAALPGVSFVVAAAGLLLFYWKVWYGGTTRA